MARIFIVTGESSGDRLGALLGQELMNQGHNVAGWGGAHMSHTPIELVQDINELKVMGWSAVISKLPALLVLLSKCKTDIEAYAPDKIVLIDFGSFNLRIARWAKLKGYSVTYYSPPKVWASREGRIKSIKAYCDQVIVLFPFERDYFRSKGMDVSYFGHPLAESISSFTTNPDFRKNNGLDEKPILSIIPGSRRSEVIYTLPIYLETAAHFPNFNVCISCAPGMQPLIQSICDGLHKSSTLIMKRSYYDLLHNSEIALVTSGTASLEVGLLGIPQIVGFRTSWINYRIAKSLIKVKYISLINLIADRSVVSELIQDDLNSTNLYKQIIRINETGTKSKMAEDYKDIGNKMNVANCLFNTSVAITKDLI